MLVLKFTLYLVIVYLVSFLIAHVIKRLGVIKIILWILINSWIFAVVIQHLIIFHGRCIHISPYWYYDMRTFIWYLTKTHVFVFFVLGIIFHLIFSVILANVSRKNIGTVLEETRKQFWMTVLFFHVALWYHDIPGTKEICICSVLHDRGIRSYHLVGVAVLLFIATYVYTRLCRRKRIFKLDVLIEK